MSGLNTTVSSQKEQYEAVTGENAAAANFAENLRDLERYRWSGHRILLGKEKNDWQERGYVLGQFGQREKDAIRSYRRFMEAGKSQGRRSELVGGGLIRSLGGWSQVLSLRGQGEKVAYDSRVLGGGDFVMEVMGEADQSVKRYLPARGRER